VNHGRSIERGGETVEHRQGRHRSARFEAGHSELRHGGRGRILGLTSLAPLAQASLCTRRSVQQRCHPSLV